MPDAYTPYITVVLLLFYTCVVMLFAYSLFILEKPDCLYRFLCSKLSIFNNRCRFTPKFRSKLYGSGSLVAVRFNLNTGKIYYINRAAADLLGITLSENKICDDLTYDSFLSNESKNNFIEALRTYGKVENYPAICCINNELIKVLITAEKDANDNVEAMVIDITTHLDLYQEIEDQYLFLQNILNALPVPVFVRDTSHQCPFTNNAFKRTFPDEPDTTSDAYSFLVFPEQYALAEQPHFTPQGSTHWQSEFATSVDGKLRHFEVHRRSLKKKNGDSYGEVGIATDITHRKKVEQDLRDTTKRYKNLFWNAAEGITTVLADGRVTEVNPAMATICGYNCPQQFLQEVQFIKQIWRYPEQRSEYMNIVLENRVAVGYDFEFVRRDGTFGWMKISSSGKFDEDGELESLETIVSDITLQKKSEMELTRCATIDSMTGINNRNALEKHLNGLLKAKPPVPFTVVFLDLNKFKPINDLHGHYTGDKVLGIIAKRLAHRCRSTDFAARLGGDEFIVVLSNVTEDKRTTMTEALLKAVEEPIILNGTTHMVSASAGSSQFPEDGTTITELLKAADASMYDMKRSNKTSKINEQLELLANR